MTKHAYHQKPIIKLFDNRRKAEPLTERGVIYKEHITKSLTNIFESALDAHISIRDLAYLINFETLRISITCLAKRTKKIGE